MQPKTILTLVALLLFVSAPAANAAEYRSLTTGIWDDYTTWQINDSGWRNAKSGEFPVCGDTATVRNGHTVDLDSDECVGYLTIQSGGEVDTNANTLTIDGSSGMDIQSGGRLEVDHGSGNVVLTGGGTHTISGTGYLKLWYSGSELSITSSSATISHGGTAGKIVGDDSNAVITVASGITFTSEITIEGALQIQAGSGTFVNNGLVEANRANETLTISEGTIRGSCDGEFKVATSDAKLEFASTLSDIAAASMGCTFTQSAGTFDIDINIDTCGPCSGTFDLTDGTLDCCQGIPCPGCS